MKRILLSLLGTCLLAVDVSAQTPSFRLTILHLNDTHQMVEPMRSKFHLLLDGEAEERRLEGEVGGLARTVTVLKALRSAAEHPLLLHGGDFHDRKWGASDYDVARDAALWNLVGLDAAAYGNHDVTNPEEWMRLLKFPVLAANGPLSAVPGLKAYTVKSYGNERVGIIGMTVGLVSEAAVVVQKLVDDLTAQGINKIVLVSHFGYEDEVKLAGRVSGLDVIVGGHSHTFLGNWRVVGYGNHEPYPTVTKAKDGGRVLVVQAGEFGILVGNLQVDFDGSGVVSSWKASPVAVVGTKWFRLDGAVSGLTEPLKAAMERHPELHLAEDDAEAAAIIEGH